MIKMNFKPIIKVRWIKASTLLLITALFSGCASNGQLVYYPDPIKVQQGLARGEGVNGLQPTRISPLNSVITSFAITTRGMQGYVLARPGDARYSSPEQRLEAAQLLIAAGADPNRPSRTAYGGHIVPPLTAAGMACQPKIARLLLERGADPMIFTDDVGTALHAVTNYCAKSPEAYEFVMAVLFHVEKMYGKAAMHEYAARRVIAPVAATSKPEGLSALQYAAWLDRQGVVAALLANKVELNQQGRVIVGDGWTPLHVASSLGRLEIATALLTAGARTDIADNMGRTAAQVAGSYAVSEGFAADFMREFAIEMKKRNPLTMLSGIKDGVRKEQAEYYKDPFRMLPYLKSEPPPVGWNLQAAMKSSFVGSASTSSVTQSMVVTAPAVGVPSQVSGGAGGYSDTRDIDALRALKAQRMEQKRSRR